MKSSPSRPLSYQAVILAGGLGARLKPLTLNQPKPMIRVAGKPFLEHQLLMLKNHGIRHVLILGGYLGSQIKNYFGNGMNWGLNVTYNLEPKALGTGGSLKLAQNKLEKKFFLLNGDTYFDFPFQKLCERLNSNPQATGVLTVYADSRRVYDFPGNVLIKKEGFVSDYRKKGFTKSKYIDAGVSIWKKDLLDLIPPKISLSLEEIIFPQLIAQNRLLAQISRKRFYDIGTPQRLKNFERHLKR